MKKNVFEVSIEASSHSSSNRKPADSPATPRKLTYDILRPRIASPDSAPGFVVRKPKPMGALPCLETPRKGTREPAQVIDSLTKLQDFRNSDTKRQIEDSEAKLAHRVSELRGDLDRLRREHAFRERALKQQTEELERDNESLRQRQCSKTSRLAEIEHQNSRIIENLQSTKTSLVMKEKSYLEKIQTLKRENGTLELELFGLRCQAFDAELDSSRIKTLEEHIEIAKLELERERHKTGALRRAEMLLSQSLRGEGVNEEEAQRMMHLRAELEKLQLENQHAKTQITELRARKVQEMGELAIRVDELLAQLPRKEDELRELKSQLRGSCVVSQPADTQLDEKIERLRNDNLLLSQLVATVDAKHEKLVTISRSHQKRGAPSVSFPREMRPRGSCDRDLSERLDCPESSSKKRESKAQNARAFSQQQICSRVDSSTPASIHYNGSFRRYTGSFQLDASPIASKRDFINSQDNIECALSSSRLQLTSEKKRRPGVAASASAKKNGFNELLSDDNAYFEKASPRRRAFNEYSLQDEATVMSISTSNYQLPQNVYTRATPRGDKIYQC